VLAYHGVDDADHFSAHLDHLVRRSRPVELDDLRAAVAGRRPLPQRAVLITFDDGERSVLDVGLPLLLTRGVPAVAFVVAGALDGVEPHWWTEVEALVAAGGWTSSLPGKSAVELIRLCKQASDDRRLAAIAELRASASQASPPAVQLRRDELRSMESAGIAIGNHTLTHPVLPRCTNDKIVTEVTSAHQILTDALGHPPAAFSYPNGDRDPRVRRAVADCGYEVAFLFDHSLSRRRPSEPDQISRLRVDSTTEMDRFRTILSGLHPALHRVRPGPRSA